MLQSTFLHLPGISRRKEEQLWARGIRRWEELEKEYPHLKDDPQGLLFDDVQLRPRRGAALKKALEDSVRAFERADTAYFAARLPPSEHYRIALAFPTATAFLDIETTGLSPYYDVTTIVGVSIGDEYKALVKGDTYDSILSFLEKAKCAVTFNGKVFDFRFLRKDYPELPLPEAHVDLRFLCRRVGLSGGQKAIEQALSLRREEAVRNIIGEKAPMLWHEYKCGDLNAAKLLIQYNHADVEGMKWLFDGVIDRLREGHPILSGSSIPRFAESLSKLTWAASRQTAIKNRIFVPTFRGPKGLAITYRRLMRPLTGNVPRVVGIDLTGSEKRPTGWSLLVGRRASTCTVSTDEEIIDATLKAAPTLVSIDSPLSIPTGRKHERDDDPGREKFGIMRECERQLKRRGVNVYPSLILNMQGLTARGRKLATRFRKEGIPVIESYPGAAQDIMGIPRKQAGLPYLKQGLKAFGISGPFLEEPVSHDELDAITSAVVGLFFWAGMYEALGNEAEDYLIIPDLNVSSETWLNRQVIGFSGPMAAGKTTAGEFMAGNGFSYGRYSDVLTRQLEKRGVEPTRKALQRYGRHVNRRKDGQRWLGVKLLQRFKDEDRIVIDGLRFPEDHAFLVERFGPAFVHIYVDASESIRRNRYIERGGSADEFDIASRDAVEAKVKVLKRFADTVVVNEGSKEAFFQSLSRIISPQGS